MQRALISFFAILVWVSSAAQGQAPPAVSGDPRRASRTPPATSSFPDANPTPTPTPTSTTSTPTPTRPTSLPTDSPSATPTPTKTPLKPLTVLTPPPLPANAPKTVARAADICEQDILLHCTGLEWGEGLATCLKEKIPDLKPICRKQVRQLTERHEKFQAARNICRQDVNRLCGEVKPGAGRVLSCLKTNETRVSRTCQSKLKSLNTTPTG